MKKDFGIKDQRRMSLFVESSMKEKTEVSKAPQDMKMRKDLKDAPRKVGLPSETEVCLTRHSKTS